ncbi:MAG: sulfite exporter TauE/SafE family protein [Candidatus Scalindua sp.]|jgi:hypothetical protein|nr:sulfite exporter TauE/SafE family protein [Candidatus Scalindua sp.]MBT6561070.1 sulfite exporter TauE/SafE family protein [Candidatus Scalindua sp.]
MNMDIIYIVGIMAIVCLASIIQSAVGFAYALLATPLLLWIGMPLPSAIVIVATCSFIQAIFGISHLRTSVPWQLSFITTFIRTATLIIGLLVLKIVVSLDPNIIKLVIGSILCVLVIIQISIKAHSLQKVHWVWGGLAFSTSGLLAGICGMGGPPLILWAMAHNWSTEKVRGFLFSVFAVSIPVQIVFMSITFGSNILWSVMTALLLTPAVFLGTKIGLPLGNQIPKPVMRRIVHLILLAIGLSSVTPSIIHYVRL